MPPNSTQNLNAKLSLQSTGGPPRDNAGINWETSPIQTSAPPVRIVGAASSSYRGGYHVSV
jgi:hypothetical protein